MALYDVIAFRVTDSEGDRTDTVPLRVPSGSYTLTEMQAIADDFLPKLEAVTDGKVTEINVTASLTINGSKANPANNSYNERGGLISFDTAGPRKDSIRIPAIKSSLMGGDSFTVNDAGAMQTFADFFTNDQTIVGVDPAVNVLSSQGYDLTDYATTGSKSIRKR